MILQLIARPASKSLRGIPIESRLLWQTGNSQQLRTLFFSGTPQRTAKSPSQISQDVFGDNRTEQLEAYSKAFIARHIGPSPADQIDMLNALSPPAQNMDTFIAQVIPEGIRSKDELCLYQSWEQNQQWDSVPQFGRSEKYIQDRMDGAAAANTTVDSFIGCGYYGTSTPEVIKRNILESPAWYTSYTPYQAEISQGRLQSLLNFQTLVTDLTGLDAANASVLDEATAAAEAMTMSLSISRNSAAAKNPSQRKTFLVSQTCHPQTIAVLRARAESFNIDVVVENLSEDASQLIKSLHNLIGVLVQYPDTYGGVHDYREIGKLTHEAGAVFSVGTDLMALTILNPPGEFGADIAFGSSQRFGIPLGYGGPHAAFFATTKKHMRKIPGRVVGVSKDRLGKPALRLALQTREQHIRREKATSNICTAQALLANMSAFYAIYHGPQGLKQIAWEISHKAQLVQQLIQQSNSDLTLVTDGINDDGKILFDTMAFQGRPERIAEIIAAAQKQSINLRQISGNKIGVSLYEGVSIESLKRLLSCFGVRADNIPSQLDNEVSSYSELKVPEVVQRKTPFLTHAVFNTYHSETELLRYIHHLQSKDLSLVHSMIPLGSCTMKLNASTEMRAVSNPGLADIHPFAPLHQTQGYQQIINNLVKNLSLITGMDDVSLQPNSGAQGEFAGLQVIKRYYEDKGEPQRKICLIPVSAHGTNPASATMAGLTAVPLKCDTLGDLDLIHLEAMCKKHQNELAAIMITYPSTYGVFEPEILEICHIVHRYGGQVYMDGANLNAQIGLCSPGDIGADVCHLNLHKTFCIPHGGGGPGVGPIGVKKHLARFLPTHTEFDPHALDPASPDAVERSKTSIYPVSAAPWGSASILSISLAYLHLMGGAGLTHQTKIALLNANYMMSRLRDHYQIAYTNRNGRCAHEFILDIRPFEGVGIKAIDVAKRLQDYGFHSPTMSWPVSNTLMIEPTESESMAELDRFCDALIHIRQEIRDIEEGRAPREGNLLKMAPHPQIDLLVSKWDRPYTREEAAYPLPWLKERKFWPTVGRVDDAFGDTNLFCTCPPVEIPIDE